MQTAFALDWISATTKDHSLSQVIGRLSFGAVHEDWMSGKGMNSYQHSLRHPLGHVIQWSNVRDEMGINCLFTGMPLKELFDRGVDTLDIVRWMHQEGFKFRRLDLALDVFGVEIDLEELQRLKYKGSIQKKPCLYKDGPDCEEGSTLELGARGSDKWVRIYDKAAQMGMKDTLWTRFEIQCKDRVAIKVGKEIAALDDAGVGKFAIGMMKYMWNPESELIQMIFNAEPQKVSGTKDTNHRTYDWLMSTVSVTMAKTILEMPHRDVMRTFQQEVEKHIKEIAAKSMNKHQTE